MKWQGIERAENRLRLAKKFQDDIKNLPVGVDGFEGAWYSFLVAFNNAFSQLEQASKSSEAGKRWYSTVKARRKNHGLLLYLQHARNTEEHNTTGSVFRFDWLLKPLSKNVKIEYRDSNGHKLLKPRVVVPQNEEMKIKFIPPGYRMRSVYDRGIVYEFPKNIDSDTIQELVRSGSAKIIDGKLDFLGALAEAVAQLENIIDEAKSEFPRDSAS